MMVEFELNLLEEGGTEGGRERDGGRERKEERKRERLYRQTI